MSPYSIEKICLKENWESNNFLNLLRIMLKQWNHTYSMEEATFSGLMDIGIAEKAISLRKVQEM